MIVIGLVLGLFGVGFLCWLLFTLAIYATPLFVGATAALVAFHHGVGLPAALIVGLAAGAVTLVAGRAAFSVSKSAVVRGVLALAFAAPAAIAGFHATLGLARIGVTSEIWRDLFAVIGAVLVGSIAFVRLGHPPDPLERGIAFISAQPPPRPLVTSTNGD